MKAKNLALILAAGMGLASCNVWSGKIGNEEVFQYKGLSENFLKVTKQDGRIIEYRDKQGDNKIDSVEITKGRYSTTYTNDEVGKEALQIAQKQYEDYLAKILEAKKKKALEDIQ